MTQPPRRPIVGRVRSLAAAVAVTVMVGVNHTPGASAQGATGSRDLPGVGAVAPTFELTSLEGQLLRLEAYRGQPFVLNFFASWCDPCRDEMPLLNASSLVRDSVDLPIATRTWRTGVQNRTFSRV
jgi:cytochrome oxidase Cu insertion factor (SCO1/SenC/PrrC family)